MNENLTEIEKKVLALCQSKEPVDIALLSPAERLIYFIAKHHVDKFDQSQVEQDITSLLKDDQYHQDVLLVLENVINSGFVVLNAMPHFLPQVVAANKIYRKIVAILLGRSVFDKDQPGKVAIVATIKGDVHDVQKNIAGFIFQKHGFGVYDYGVMVDTEKLVKYASQQEVRIMLISVSMKESIDELKLFLEYAKKENISIPIFLAGAAINDPTFPVVEYYTNVYLVHKLSDLPAMLKKIPT